MKPLLQSLQISGGSEERLRILTSQQTVDIRLHKRKGIVAKGELLLFDHHTPFIAMVDIVYFRYCRLGDVTSEEYQADGYNTQEELLADLQRYYPTVTLDSVVTVIKYANVRGYWVDHPDKYIETFFPLAI